MVVLRKSENRPREIPLDSATGEGEVDGCVF